MGLYDKNYAIFSAVKGSAITFLSAFSRRLSQCFVGEYRRVEDIKIEEFEASNGVKYKAAVYEIKLYGRDHAFYAFDEPQEALKCLLASGFDFSGVVNLLDFEQGALPIDRELMSIAKTLGTTAGIGVMMVDKFFDDDMLELANAEMEGYLEKYEFKDMLTITCNLETAIDGIRREMAGIANFLDWIENVKESWLAGGKRRGDTKNIETILYKLTKAEGGDSFPMLMTYRVEVIGEEPVLSTCKIADRSKEMLLSGDACKIKIEMPKEICVQIGDAVTAYDVCNGKTALVGIVTDIL